MANDYLGLMQSINQPRQQEQAWGRQNQNNAMAAVFDFIKQKQVSSKIKGMIKEAQDKGYKVEYKIDPNTGQTTPVISSGDNNIFKMLEEYPELKDKYEVGLTGTGKGKLQKKKTVSDQEILAAKSILGGDFKGGGILTGSNANIKNPLTGETEQIDLSTKAGVDKAIQYKWGPDWKEKPELAEIVSLYDEKFPTAPVSAPARVPTVTSPKATYKEGETRNIGGTDYVRDKKGQWIPSGE